MTNRDRCAFTAITFALLVHASARAQEGAMQPAHNAQEQADAQRERAQGEPPREDEHSSSWEAPEVVVTGERELKEEQRIGEYAQPRWTVPRRFPTARIYVVPAGTLQLDWTLDAHMPLEKLDARRYRSKYEFEFGLGNRLQLDFFLQTQQTGEGPGSPLAIRRENIELRYALADWGCVWGNPTLYASWGRRHENPDVLEFKLLLGDELAPRWHWGFNVVWERELSGAQTNGFLAIAGISYTVIDQKFSIGGELRAEVEDVKGARGEFETAEFVIGPSLQWKPRPAMHIDLAVLAGFEKEPAGGEEGEVGEEEEELEALLWPWLVVGWEF